MVPPSTASVVSSIGGAAVMVMVVSSPPTVSFRFKPTTASVVDVDVLLQQPLEALGDDLDVVRADRQRLDGIGPRAAGCMNGRKPPVSVFVAVTCALATAAPLGSLMDPWMPPPLVLCAWSGQAAGER